jgi:hypothetical protein
MYSVVKSLLMLSKFQHVLSCKLEKCLERYNIRYEFIVFGTLCRSCFQQSNHHLSLVNFLGGNTKALVHVLEDLPRLLDSACSTRTVFQGGTPSLALHFQGNGGRQELSEVFHTKEEGGSRPKARSSNTEMEKGVLLVIAFDFSPSSFQRHALLQLAGYDLPPSSPLTGLVVSDLIFVVSFV